MEKLDVNLRFVTLKNRFCKSSNSIEEKIELRKLKETIRKKINNIERLKIETKVMEKLQIEGRSKTTKLLADLNIKEGILVDELLEIETRLERQKIPKKTTYIIKNSII